jgi:hypothetical protein
VIAAIPRAAAAAPRDLESGPPGKVFTYRRSDFLAPPAGAGAPQAFLVEMPTPGAVIPPHFHREDEFQVVVAGGGSLGKHALDGVTVHFADAYTPYGPIRVGPDGLAFFTLRARADAGAQYMPESRAAMIRKARRSVAASLPAGGEMVDLWSPHDDGLAAWIVRARPRAELAHPPGDGGRYYLIVEGSVVHGGRELPRWSCVWTGPGTARPRLRAGVAGADVVVAQFPEREPPARS